MSTQTGSRAAVPFARGAVAGVVAWLGGYLVTYLLHAGSIRDSLGSAVVEALAGDPVTWKFVGWLYYNAHFVDASVPGLLGRSTVNFLSGAEEPALLVLYALVPAVLLVAGLAAAWGRASEPVDGAKAGATVALGYFPVAVAGAVLTRVSVGDATGGPALVTAALLAGLVYPLVVGAVGGTLASLADGR